jgi:hypothetical protein
MSGEPCTGAPRRTPGFSMPNEEGLQRIHAYLADHPDRDEPRYLAEGKVWGSDKLEAKTEPELEELDEAQESDFSFGVPPGVAGCEDDEAMSPEDEVVE